MRFYPRWQNLLTYVTPIHISSYVLYLYSLGSVNKKHFTRQYRAVKHACEKC